MATFTDADMRRQVTTALAGECVDYDVVAIVDQLRQENGTVPIDDVPAHRFWAIVEKFSVVG
jgi:hypothetical protein